MREIKPKMSGDTLEAMPAKMEKKPIYPTIRIDLTHLPEAKKWKVGDMYDMKLHLKMVGLSQSRFQNESEYEIHGIDTGEKMDKMDEEDKKEDSEM